jgi:molybdopterin-synthase adenylyltransferase
MTNERFDRNIRFFGIEGQKLIAATKVTVVGLGGLGSHLAQQLALLGTRELAIIDSEELAETDRNRHICASASDPVPGSLKTDICERLILSIDPSIRITKIPETLVSEAAFHAVIEADYVFGCLDSEGARLVLTELCSAYARPYFDLATDIPLRRTPPVWWQGVFRGRNWHRLFGLLR